MKYTRETVYDHRGHYLPVIPQEDPSYPGITPEPEGMAVVFIGMEPIPVGSPAGSWSSSCTGSSRWWR